MTIIHSWRQHFSPQSLLFCRWNVQYASGQVNPAGADTRHYVYGWMIWPRANWQKQRKRQSRALQTAGQERGRTDVFLISPGQVRSVWHRVWSHSRLKKRVRCQPHGASLQQHEPKLCLLFAPPSTVNARKCELFLGQILGLRKIPALFGTLFQSFLDRNFGALCCLFVLVSFHISLILIDKKASACRYHRNMSHRIENFLL